MNLCKLCYYYKPGDKTCGRSLVAISRNKVYHDYAKAVRIDPKRCGPQAKWFLESPAEELLKSILDLK